MPPKFLHPTGPWSQTLPLLLLSSLLGPSFTLPGWSQSSPTAASQFPTVLFAGYSDSRVANQMLSLRQTERSVFLKIGYAFVL